MRMNASAAATTPLGPAKNPIAKMTQASAGHATAHQGIRWGVGCAIGPFSPSEHTTVNPGRDRGDNCEGGSMPGRTHTKTGPRTPNAELPSEDETHPESSRRAGGPSPKKKDTEADDWRHWRGAAHSLRNSIASGQP